MMKKALLSLSIPFLAQGTLAQMPEKEEVISEKPGVHSIYHKDLAAGLHDIMLAASKDRKEDAWLFNGRAWYDVGFISDGCGVFISQVKLNYVLENTLQEKDALLVHDHVTNVDSPAYGFELSYMPPSPSDLYSLHDRLEAGLYHLKEGVVDPSGLWLYDIEDDVSYEDIELYRKHIKGFLLAQGSDSFDFKKEYELLRDSSELLGIEIYFQRISVDLFSYDYFLE